MGRPPVGDDAAWGVVVKNPDRTHRCGELGCQSDTKPHEVGFGGHFDERGDALLPPATVCLTQRLLARRRQLRDTHGRGLRPLREEVVGGGVVLALDEECAEVLDAVPAEALGGRRNLGGWHPTVHMRSDVLPSGGR